MFAKFTAVIAAISVLATFAVASPMPQTGANSCSTGQLQCCEQVQTADSLNLSVVLLDLLGLVLPSLDVPIGISCSGINGVGVGSGNACSSNTVCCDSTSTGGLLSVGCVPVL
ncbi:fungal hydrophobin-domain-containing protein [Trametes meyenii]|nr:fungal hydrophobin-domain-containing protein [Trametes meyenii]